MLSRKPNLVLNEEELGLLNGDPEECFRHAIERGALSLNRITADLSPRVAAIVRSIATGERLTPPEGELESDLNMAAHQRRQWEETQRMLSNHYSQLTRMLDEQVLTPDEAMEVALAIDHILGRYLTGTKYAAP